MPNTLDTSRGSQIVEQEPIAEKPRVHYISVNKANERAMQNFYIRSARAAAGQDPNVWDLASRIAYKTRWLDHVNVKTVRAGALLGAGALATSLILLRRWTPIYASRAFDENDRLLVESNSKLEGGVKTDIVIPFDAKTAIDINTNDKDRALDYAVSYPEKNASKIGLFSSSKQKSANKKDGPIIPMVFSSANKR